MKKNEATQREEKDDEIILTSCDDDRDGTGDVEPLSLIENNRADSVMSWRHPPTKKGGCPFAGR